MTRTFLGCRNHGLPQNRVLEEGKGTQATTPAVREDCVGTGGSLPSPLPPGGLWVNMALIPVAIHSPATLARGPSVGLPLWHSILGHNDRILSNEGSMWLSHVAVASHMGQ